MGVWWEMEDLGRIWRLGKKKRAQRNLSEAFASFEITKSHEILREIILACFEIRTHVFVFKGLQIISTLFACDSLQQTFNINPSLIFKKYFIQIYSDSEPWRARTRTFSDVWLSWFEYIIFVCSLFCFLSKNEQLTHTFKVQMC